MGPGTGLDPGTCAFCGHGGGYLGEQGDETSELLHSAVRAGEPGEWTYQAYPGSEPASPVRWCGECVGGLAHKFQRHDDQNLRAAFVAARVRLSLDPLRWEFWELDREGDERRTVIEAGRWPDDTAIHMDKLRLERDLGHMEREQMRRLGVDLTGQGWRP